MRSKNKVLALVQSVVLGMWLALPAFAQETGGTPASNSMHQAGEDTESAAKNAYHGTAMALDDTRITTEVKTDLSCRQGLAVRPNSRSHHRWRRDAKGHSTRFGNSVTR